MPVLPNALERLMMIGLGLGYVRKTGERYGLTPTAKKWLAGGDVDLRGYLDFGGTCLARHFDDLEETIRTGRTGRTSTPI